MRYRYGIYAMIVLFLAAAPLLLFDDMDVGLTVTSLIIWSLVIIVATVIAIRAPRFRRSRRSRRRQIEIGRISSRGVPAPHQIEHSEGPALIEYGNGSV